MDEKTIVLHLLERCVNGIEGQFVNVLDHHESDFMSAYRVSNYQSQINFNLGPHDSSQKGAPVLEEQAGRSCWETSKRR